MILLENDVSKLFAFNTFILEKKTADGYEGLYYPPLNVILSQFFFSKNSKYHQLYGTILDLVHYLTENMDIQNCDKYASQIHIVKKQILFENQEFQANVEDLLRSLNDGKLDWEYFKKNKQERIEFKAKIDDGRMEILLGLALFRRAHQVADVYNASPIAAKKLQTFFDTFKSAIKINISILRSIADGSTWLADATADKWNTLNDFQIIFGLLYERPGIDKRLVTNDSKIKNACLSSGQGHVIISLDDYKKTIGL
jgi:hypothetical protein